MIKHSSFSAPLLLILLLPVVCQTKPLTERFIVELEQKAVIPNQSFSIKPGRTLPGNPSVITIADDYTEPNLPSYEKRHKPYSYEVKTTIIESISWQWLYATNLLVAYEVILTTKNAPLSYNSFSWVPVEVVIVVNCLLRSYWNPESPLFNPIQQQETSQNQPFVITTMMPGSGHDQQQGQVSESSGQRSPQVTGQPISSLSSTLYSVSDGNNEGPQQHSHTLGLNCFVHPCHGVCQFRPSSDKDGVVSDSPSAGIAETTQPVGQKTCNVVEIGEDGFLTQCEKFCKNARALAVHKSKYHSGKKTCPLIVVGEDGQHRPCGTVCRNAKILSDHKGRCHTGQQICDVIVVGEDGQPRPCAKVCKNAKAFLSHKHGCHSGQKICDLTVVGEDDQQRQCAMVFKNVRSLRTHKNRYHTGQKTCEVTSIGEDGQQRPCGKVCKNVQVLLSHKSKCHSGQKACDLITVGEDGQPQPCGTICKNAGILSQHKSRVHCEQKICGLTKVGEDGQQRSCGVILKNAPSLASHKSRYHTGQKICDVRVVENDGLQRLCGKAYKNAVALTEHKRKHHSGPKTCDVTVVGEDCQLWPCGYVCNNAHDLSEHKRKHRKRKPDDVNRNDDLNP